MASATEMGPASRPVLHKVAIDPAASGLARKLAAEVATTGGADPTLTGWNVTVWYELPWLSWVVVRESIVLEK